MKRKKLQKLIAILMLTAFVASSLSGCKSTSKTTDVEEKGNTKSTTENTSSKEVVPISFARTTDASVESNVFAQTKESWEKNRWNDLYAKELGVDVVYKWVATTAEQGTQKLNAAIATGDIPDVTCVDKTTLKQMADAGLIIDIAPYFEKYASDRLKKLIENAGSKCVEAATYDGAQYGLPYVDCDLERADMLWLRQDWLDQAGLSAPQSIAIGVPLSMILTVMIAYPLSKEVEHFRMRTVYVWFFFFTMLFSGGLIPGYMLIQNLHMMDSIWALVLPGAVPVFNIVLMLNFFRGIPKELEEAAEIDGANQWKTCFRIYLPCAKPSIATLSLFTFVGNWNSWFDGLLFSNFSSSYPLASYLQTVIVNRDMTLIGAGDLQALTNISDRTVRCAQIFMGLLPILLVYPFVQKHFVKGIVVGSVKG